MSDHALGDQTLSDEAPTSADQDGTPTGQDDRPLGNAEDEAMATVPVHRVKAPLADTGVESGRVSETHDVHGGGNPRLVPLFDDSIDLAQAKSEPSLIRELSLLPGVTTIGSETASEICPVSYTHLRAHETVLDLVCRLLLEKKKKYTPH